MMNDNFNPMPEGPMWRCQRCNVWNDREDATCWLCEARREWREVEVAVVSECTLGWLRQDNDQVEMCSICLEYCGGATRIGLLGCGHVFHINCIIEWVNTPGANALLCPLCKAPIEVVMANMVVIDE